MKDKTYDKWINRTVKRNRDGMYGLVVEPQSKLGRTWWLVEWRDGSRKATPERDMTIVADGEGYPNTHATARRTHLRPPTPIPAQGGAPPAGGLRVGRDPNYPALEEASQAPPEPSGTELATFERPGGRYGPPTELRASLDEYEGHPFLSLRVWTCGPDGGWYPTKKGVSVKLREARGLAEALLEAARLAGVEWQGGGTPARRPAPRRSHSQGRGQQGIPLTGSAASPPWGNSFDEFA